MLSVWKINLAGSRVRVAPTVLVLGEVDFATAATDLASGDFASGLDAGLQDVDHIGGSLQNF
jgi:hypothetical protein